jgi:hypothetical protein
MYNTKIGSVPVGFTGKYYGEFDVSKRFEGHSYWLNISAGFWPNTIRGVDRTTAGQISFSNFSARLASESCLSAIFSSSCERAS